MVYFPCVEEKTAEKKYFAFQRISEAEASQEKVMKDQEDKSDAHRALQPKNMEKSSTQLIMMYDIAGWGTNEIAAELQMTASRVSIIKNSPLYIEQRRAKMREIASKVIDKKAKDIAEDQAMEVLRGGRVQAATRMVSLIDDGKTDFVKLAASEKVLGINGITEKKKDSEGPRTIVVEERIAQRFGWAKEYAERTRTISITETPA